jgi:hypothetical protein
MSHAPSIDDESHREVSAVFKIPPRSAAGQVLTSRHSCKHRSSTLSHTAPGIAKQPQAPRDAASRQNRSRVEASSHQDRRAGTAAWGRQPP